MIAHSDFAYLAGVLIAAAIFYIIFIRRDQFDAYADPDIPPCFRGFGITPPSGQERAENGCETCRWRGQCMDRVFSTRSILK